MQIALKIIHVLSGLTKGGGERVVVELANIAVGKGDDVTIIAGWPVDPGLLQNSIHPKVNVRFISQSKKYAYLQIIPWILKNRKWICDHDVLHCHLTYGAVFGSAVNIILKKPPQKKSPVIVETNHAVGMAVPKFNRWIHSRMLLLRNGLVFMARDAYWDHFIQKHSYLKTAIISNGIAVQNQTSSPETKQQFRQRMGVKPDCKYLVGTVSMLRPDRKPWLYIPIFKDIYRALGNDVHFILAGGGIEHDKIKALVEAEGLSEHVYMPGLINDPVSLMANMDMYVSLSAGETAGISMIEASMCNVPVVGIQLNENYHPKKEDWVWSHTDPKEIAKKIIFLLQNAQERNQFAEKQKHHVNDNLTSEAMYAAYNAFYRKLLSGKK